MKAWLRGFFYSFPVQLLFLHFRKYQVLLVLWFILFSTINGSFMHAFGADSLFLAPEYLGSVNWFGTAIVGISIGMFIVSWNITSFILFSRHFRFLSATTNPFLKYCMNNFAVPLIFLIFYFLKAWQFLRFKELMPRTEIVILAMGFLAGLIFIIAVSFFYFFRADRSILRRMMPVINNPGEYITHLKPGQYPPSESKIIKVEWYLDKPYTVHKVRDVSHYTREFIESIFKRHHFAAVLSVFAAFLFLIGIGFFLENKALQLPAAASVAVFFAILIGVSGAFTYFLQSWSVPYLLALIFMLNIFYKLDWIDPRNKAYGLNYQDKKNRPAYTREHLLALTSPDNVLKDSINMIAILDKWKAKQKDEKPLFIVINTSGGGHRSATFTMKTLQYLDSITNGEIMNRTFLITGASGGMIGATYFRELFNRKNKGENIHLQDQKYVDDISGDLLNPVFSSFVARDLIAPAQKFKVGPYSYIKDRAYAFEMKLNDNTNGFLNKQLKDYTLDESQANIPLIFFNSVVTRDGKKMIASTQRVSYMMRNRQDTLVIPETDPDGICFTSFFRNQDPHNLRILTALRMNATFPIVLPNVWLPSNPVIDVMDAGLRDNYGQETALRFIEFFDDWILENTRGVLVLQLRDRAAGGWDYPYLSDDISDHATKPFFLLQHNWYKMMEYVQNDILSYYIRHTKLPIRKIVFQYAAANEENKAALNFHLTQSEKKDILASPKSAFNQESFRRALAIINEQQVVQPVRRDE